MKKLLAVSALILNSATHAMAWEVVTKTDNFTEETNTYIFSDRVVPDTQLDWPYTNPTVYIYWDCDQNTFVMHNSANNLNSGAPSSYGNFSTHLINIKVDGVIKRNVSMTQGWGSNFMILSPKQRFNNTSYSIANAKKSLVIQLNHYGSGLRSYKFDLQGLDRNVCGEKFVQPRTMNNPSIPEDAYVKIENVNNGEVSYWPKHKWEAIGSSLTGLDFIKITFLK